MKKTFAILLAVMLLASMATIASAANTTTLTTTVPAAKYTLNIPADRNISFGATKTSIGELTVTGTSGFAEGKDLKVSITYEPFTCEDVNTSIPISLSAWYSADNGSNLGETVSIASGSALTFKGKSNGSVENCVYKSYYLDYLNLEVNSADWGKALAGEYTATITFTAEVVAG